jgi:hypothetical protein
MIRMPNLFSPSFRVTTNKKATPSKRNDAKGINYFCDQHATKLFT